MYLAIYCITIRNGCGSVQQYIGVYHGWQVCSYVLRRVWTFKREINFIPTCAREHDERNSIAFYELIAMYGQRNSNDRMNLPEFFLTILVELAWLDVYVWILKISRARELDLMYCGILKVYLTPDISHIKRNWWSKLSSDVSSTYTKVVITLSICITITIVYGVMS